MALDFPNSPSIGDTFTSNGISFTWNGSVWNASRVVAGRSFIVSDTAPNSPTEGYGWFNSSTGQFFIYYDDFWVEASSNEAGPSAYDIAVAYGYSGTEAQWANDMNPQTIANAATAIIVDSAPSTLDTLNELAAALGDDPNFATTIVNQIGNLETEVDTKTSTGKAIAMAIVFGG